MSVSCRGRSPGRVIIPELEQIRQDWTCAWTREFIRNILEHCSKNPRQHITTLVLTKLRSWTEIQDTEFEEQHITNWLKQVQHKQPLQHLVPGQTIADTAPTATQPASQATQSANEMEIMLPVTTHYHLLRVLLAHIAVVVFASYFFKYEYHVLVFSLQMFVPAFVLFLENHNTLTMAMAMFRLYHHLSVIVMSRVIIMTVVVIVSMQPGDQPYAKEVCCVFDQVVSIVTNLFALQYAVNGNDTEGVDVNLHFTHYLHVLFAGFNNVQLKNDAPETRRSSKRQRVVYRFLVCVFMCWCKLLLSNAKIYTVLVTVSACGLMLSNCMNCSIDRKMKCIRKILHREKLPSHKQNEVVKNCTSLLVCMCGLACLLLVLNTLVSVSSQPEQSYNFTFWHESCNYHNITTVEQSCKRLENGTNACVPKPKRSTVESDALNKFWCNAVTNVKGAIIATLQFFGYFFLLPPLFAGCIIAQRIVKGMMSEGNGLYLVYGMCPLMFCRI